MTIRIAATRFRERLEIGRRVRLRGRFRGRRGLLAFLAVMGPGLIAGIVGNDAGGITTYSVLGASTGLTLLWLFPITMAILAIVQEMAARLGVVTGQGLSDLIRDRFGVRPTAFAMLVLLVLTAVRQLTVHLRSGVTTLRDCAARGKTMFWVREAIRRGFFAGPRLQLAGRAITHSGGHIWWAGGVADSPEEIRRNVRVLVSEGADVIKLVASGGGTRGGIPYLASYTVDELRVGVEAAHALERRTVAHARATRSMSPRRRNAPAVNACWPFVSPRASATAVA